MSKNVDGRFRKVDWPLIVVSAGVLAVYLYYTVNFIILTPYPGIVFTLVSDGWLVNDSVQESVEIDDLLVQIGDLSYEEYTSDRLLVPFQGYGPGELVSPIITADGRQIELVMREATLQDRLRRLFSTLWFLPFWISGTAVLLFVRRRDNVWRLLISMMYLSALWSALGGIANWHIGGSSLLLSTLEWLMVPVFLHLHMTVPGHLFGRFSRYFIRSLYVISVPLIVAELTSLLPPVLALYALVLAILASTSLLLARALGRKTAPSDRLASRLMLTGTGLAFGPGVLYVAVTGGLDIAVPSSVGVALATISLPLLPISYTYAIYKRHLGEYEFRANRLITVYGFVLTIPTVFILVLLFGEQWIDSSAGRTFYLLTVSVFFALVTPPLLVRFQRGLNRLAYGAAHNPDDILRVFARRIPSALKREALTDLLQKEIAPSLLIRQSALYLFSDAGVELAYADGLADPRLSRAEAEIGLLLESAGTYHPPEPSGGQSDDWVRLPLALVSREKTIGLWLLGRRDPDDFYPKNDIDLLQTIANQVAPVVENIRLYEALRQHADSLAEEVSKQTAELQAERDKTQAVLDSAGEGVFFTDAEGKLLYANPAMASLSGFSAPELVGKGLELWLGNEEQPENYRQMRASVEQGRPWSGELLLRCKDKVPLNVNLTLAPIQSLNGSTAGFVGVHSDISKLKEIDRLKSNIISSVSHELKTPLTTIKTYLMLLQHGKSEKRADYLAVLDRETERLTTLIVDLLDLSTLDAGKIPAQFESVDALMAARLAIESCLARANEQGIELEIEVGEQVPHVYADASQLNQVLTNLLVNAIHYSPAGANVILSAGAGQLDSSPAVWFRVTDSGPGIDDEEIPKLFDRFFRGRAARSSGVPGTGLGLAICQEIVDRHQGKIQVANNPDSGASFTVWFRTSSELLVESPVPHIELQS